MERVLALLICCAAPAAADCVELVAVRVPVDSGIGECEGCQLVRIGQDGRLTVLTPGFAGAKDPSVAFDGTAILFAGRRSANDQWQIWRIGIDGSNSEQVISVAGNTTAPLHVGSLFHLDDEQPSNRIVFLSDAHGWLEASTGLPATALYAAGRDGTDVRRISFNLNRDLAPEVLDNGRLVYPSRGAGGNTSVLAVNIDGTDAMPYTDTHPGPESVRMLAVGKDRVYLVASDEPGPLGGGELFFASRRRPLRTLRHFNAAPAGWHHSPRPLSNGDFLVSFLEQESRSGYDLVTLDPGTGRRLKLVAAATGYHLIDAHELISRPQVRGRSSFVDLSVETGIFYCISSHISDRPKIKNKVRAATRLRVVEGIPLLQKPIGPPPPSRQTLGEAPLESDGSFNIEIPASTPVSFDLLDDDGNVLARQETWTWVMPRESRGCIGCHEDPEMVPPNDLAQAVVKPAHRMSRESSNAGKNPGSGR